MQLQLHTITIEDLVPADHFLRKLDVALDLSFVYEMAAPLYSKKYGRPPIDPVMLVKYLLVGFLYGIPSERQIELRIQTDVALRWYLRLDLFDAVPDHSTISQLRRRKPKFRKVFRRLFEEVMRQCIETGLVSGRLVATDSTHVRANASRASEVLVEMPEEPGAYYDRLDAYEEEALKQLPPKKGRREGKRTQQLKRKNRRTKKRVSVTDPEAGHMKRPGKPEGPHYLSHQTLDTDHGIILDVTVTSGDASDSTPYLDQIEHVHRDVIPIQAATADAAYDFPLAHEVLLENDITFYVRPQAHFDCTQVELKRDAFSYEPERDCFRCPNGKNLYLNTLQRSASSLHWVYLRKMRFPSTGRPDEGKILVRVDGGQGWQRLEPLHISPLYHREIEGVKGLRIFQRQPAHLEDCLDRRLRFLVDRRLRFLGGEQETCKFDEGSCPLPAAVVDYSKSKGLKRIQLDTILGKITQNIWGGHKT